MPTMPAMYRTLPPQLHSCHGVKDDCSKPSPLYTGLYIKGAWNKTCPSQHGHNNPKMKSWIINNGVEQRSTFHSGNMIKKPAGEV